jgi:hypothetical protein
MNTVTRIASISLLVAAAGCSGSSPGADPSSSADDSATYSQYVVQLHGNAEPTIVVGTITAHQQKALTLARERAVGQGGNGELQQAIAQDNGCLGSSLWLYSQPNRAGHMACVSGMGTLQLASLDGYGDRGVLWDANVRSYWAGSEAGGFWGPSMSPGSLFCGSGFTAWQAAVDHVDSCTAAAHQVHLDN